MLRDDSTWRLVVFVLLGPCALSLRLARGLTGEFPITASYCLPARVPDREVRRPLPVIKQRPRRRCGEDRRRPPRGLHWYA